MERFFYKNVEQEAYGTIIFLKDKYIAGKKTLIEKQHVSAALEKTKQK